MDIDLTIDFGSAKISYEFWATHTDKDKPNSSGKGNVINRFLFKKSDAGQYLFPPQIGSDNIGDTIMDNDYLLDNVNTIAVNSYKDSKSADLLLSEYYSIIEELFLHIKKTIINESPRVKHFKHTIISLALFVSHDFLKKITKAAKEVFGQTVIIDNWYPITKHYWNKIVENKNKGTVIVDFGWSFLRFYLIDARPKEKEAELIDYERYPDLSGSAFSNSCLDTLPQYFKTYHNTDFLLESQKDAKAKIITNIKGQINSFILKGIVGDFNYNDGNIIIAEKIDQLFLKRMLETIRYDDSFFYEVIFERLEGFLNRNGINKTDVNFFLVGSLARINSMEDKLKEFVVENTTIQSDTPVFVVLNGLKQLIQEAEENVSEKLSFITTYSFVVFLGELNSDILIDLKMAGENDNGRTEKNYEVDFSGCSVKDYLTIYVGVLIGRGRATYKLAKLDIKLDGNKLHNNNSTPLKITTDYNLNGGKAIVNLTFDFNEMNLSKKHTMILSLAKRRCQYD